MEDKLTPQWDKLVASDSGATPTSRPPGLRILHLREIPEVRARKDIHRRLSQITPALRNKLGRLASGLEPWPLYLFGPVGTGKTCAALAMCDASQEALYTTVREMADNTMAGTVAQLWELLRSYGFAVLDEIGTRSSDLFYGIIKDFADIREHVGRVAIYGSNLTPDELCQTFDDRIADRLLCGTIFHLDGQSRRMPAGGTQ